MANRVVHEFAKNSQEQVRVSLTEYHGHRLIELRAYYSSGDEWLPSKKGLALSIDKLDELEIAVRKLREELGNETRP